MEDSFKNKNSQREKLEAFQLEIQKLLSERPELILFQQNLEAQLDKIGTIDTPEGRANRAALAFSLMRESFFKLREGLEEYQIGLTDALNRKTKPKLRIIK